MEKNKEFSKVFTIPNVISMFRLLLVPFFAALYLMNFENHFIWAIGALVVSGISDILDGAIARKFNMISSLGKLLDPLADKLTQGVAGICISIVHPEAIPLLILFCAKEFTMLLGAVMLLKTGLRPSESKWWGKLSTVATFAYLFMVLLTDIFPVIPGVYSLILEVIAAICLTFSLFNYYPIFKEIQSGEYDLEKEKSVDKDADK